MRIRFTKWKYISNRKESWTWLEKKSIVSLRNCKSVTWIYRCRIIDSESRFWQDRWTFGIVLRGVAKHVSRVTSANAWCQVFSSRARDLFSHGGKILIERSESKDLATVGQRVYRSRERGEIGLQSSFLGNVLERLPVKICLRWSRWEEKIYKSET